MMGSPWSRGQNSGGSSLSAEALAPRAAGPSSDMIRLLDFVHYLGFLIEDRNSIHEHFNMGKELEFLLWKSPERRSY